MPKTLRDEEPLELARTPRGDAYGAAAWERACDRIFPRSWHLVATLAELPGPGSVLPVTLLPGALDEPLLLVRGEAGVRAFSNVCTHRGALLVDAPCRVTALRCPYHGRRFGLDGQLRGAPEMDGLPGFPGPDDHLPEVAVGVWGPFVFVSLDPIVPFAELTAPLTARAGFLPLGEFRRDPAGDRHFDVAAHWSLWCENYLEGFHVPWVHPGLAAALDWRSYRTAVDGWTVIQVGVSGDTVFSLPADHPDAGLGVGGLYFHLFPLTTFNFYPWGLSLNVVEPRGSAATRIRYQSWVWREELRGAGAGAGLDTVEIEDDAIVERVQRGVTSRLYRGGRYSPAWEVGVHHFHRLLARVEAEGPARYPPAR